MARYQRRDPLLAYNFQVSLLDSKSSDGVGLGTIALSSAGMRTMAGFSEITGLEVAMEVEDYAAGGINDRVLKFPGRMKWSNLVFKRGLVAKRDPLDGSDMWTWFQSYLEGRGVRKDGLIILQNQNREPQIVWSFRRGLPLRWTGPALNAGQSSVAIENVEIAHEGITKVKGGGELGQAIRGAIEAIF